MKTKSRRWLSGVLFAGAGLVFVGCDSDEPAKPNYSQSSVPIGVSDSLNQEAVDRFGLDLSENLDPKLIPALMADAMKETADANVSENDFLPTLVGKISNKIRDISTIDLNNDGLADPVLVVPQVDNGGQDYLTFSILVPDPAEVGELPPGSDQDAWRDIAENKSVELMTTSVVREGEEMRVQSAPNPQMYQAPMASPYYMYSSPSLTSIFLTAALANMMFAPRYGGWGYSPGPMQQVSTVRSNRSAYTSNLSSATPSKTPAKTTGGQSVSANKFRSTSAKSLNQIKSTQFRKQSGSSTAGGFGRSNTGSTVNRSSSTPAKKPAVQSAPVRRPSAAPARKSSGGFGRRKR
jgi:hypothetical protein